MKLNLLALTLFLTGCVLDDNYVCQSKSDPSLFSSLSISHVAKWDSEVYQLCKTAGNMMFYTEQPSQSCDVNTSKVLLSFDKVSLSLAAIYRKAESYEPYQCKKA